MSKLLTFPNHHAHVLSIRAKALVFNDPQSQALLQHLERIGRTDVTVLIIGETGTGKELVARYLHEQSGSQGPFVAVNCGALSESLIEAELFGHEAGAYTGAAQGRAGWFEAAEGGTLFLDEIGDLPLAMQVKLLRVLQERQVVRIGSRKPLPVDLRLIAATNVDLEKAVEAGHFRADLFYRLSVATVELPPLLERRGDILPLARHFIEVYRSKLELPEISIAADAEQALLDYEWPGNIRELENVIHYALIVSSGHTIGIGNLKLGHRSRRGEPATGAGVRGGASLGEHFARLFEQPHPGLYEHVEEVLVKTAFAHCAENQVRTARLLGISRNILRAQLKRFGLLPGRDVADIEDLGESARLADGVDVEGAVVGT
jgi:sigma-54-specific transcriptional regulator